jgi:hypothetical protein
MIYKRNIELVVKKKKKINMEKEKEELNKNILPGQEITCNKSIGSKIIKKLEYIKYPSHINTSQELYSVWSRGDSSDADLLDLPNVVGPTKDLMIPENFERDWLYDNQLDLSNVEEVKNEHIIPYKLYKLYILIITFMNKYKIYIFFLIIFILLLNNYFKPT